MKKVYLTVDQEVIPKGRLAQLEAKERAHDAYVWATKRMADAARSVRESDHPRAYVAGYGDSLHQFCQFVVHAPDAKSPAGGVPQG